MKLSLAILTRNTPADEAVTRATRLASGFSAAVLFVRVWKLRNDWFSFICLSAIVINVDHLADLKLAIHNDENFWAVLSFLTYDLPCDILRRLSIVWQDHLKFFTWEHIQQRYLAEEGVLPLLYTFVYRCDNAFVRISIDDQKLAIGAAEDSSRTRLLRQVLVRFFL